MNWLERIKHNQSLKQFGNKVKKSNYPHTFIDLDRANKIGILINIGDFGSKELIILTDYINRLEEKGKKIFVFEMNLKRKSEPMFTDSNHSSIFINPESLNWLGHPSIDLLKSLNNLNCDILLNLDASERLTSRYICGLSNAQTRVGRFGEGFESYYELMVDVPKETSLKETLKQFEKYLEMIEK